MKPLLTLLLIVLLGGVGYYIYDRESEKHALRLMQEADAKTAIEMQALNQLADAAREARRNQVEKAILEGRVIEGMDEYEVRRAWNRPQDINRYTFPEEWKKFGTYEVWEYNDIKKGFLLMSVNGKVLQIGKYKE